MGISGQNNIAWKSNEISFENVIFLLRMVHQEQVGPQIASNESATAATNTTTAMDTRPKMTIDAFLLAYKYIYHQKNSISPVQAIKIIASSIAEKCIDVILDLDGDKRHESKRASVQRRTARDKAKVRQLEVRSKLVPLLHEANETDDTREEKKVLSKELRTLETAGNRFLPHNFADLIKEFQSTYQSNGKGTITIGNAPFQADPNIAKAAIDGKVCAIVSGDSDFSMYVGPSGRNGLGDLMLRNPQIQSRSSKLLSFEIVTSQSRVVQFVDRVLGNKMGNKPLWKSVPKFPLFDKMDDHQARALIAIALGCDVNPGGINNLGASAVFKFLAAARKEIRDSSGSLSLVDCLLRKLCLFAEKQKKKPVVDKSQIADNESFLCLAESLMYEMTYYPDTYMHGPPQQLCRYNEAFQQNTLKYGRMGRQNPRLCKFLRF